MRCKIVFYFCLFVNKKVSNAAEGIGANLYVEQRLFVRHEGGRRCASKETIGL